MEYEYNQKTVSVIIVALGFVAVLVVSYFIIRQKTGAAVSEKEETAVTQEARGPDAAAEAAKKKAAEEEMKKRQGYGEACKAAVEYLAASAKSYMEEKGAYPLSAGDLKEFDSRVTEMTEGATHWVENGSPEFDSFFDKKFTVTGFCADGEKYYYDSEAGYVQHEAY